MSTTYYCAPEALQLEGRSCRPRGRPPPLPPSDRWPTGRSEAECALPHADRAAHRLDQLRGVVADAVLEDGLHFLDVGDLDRGIAAHDDQVGELAGHKRADAVRLAEEGGAVGGGDVDRLERRKAGLDEQLQLALAAEHGQNASVAC